MEWFVAYPYLLAYRIENEDGLGPFVTGAVPYGEEEDDPEGRTARSMPSPWLDRLKRGTHALRASGRALYAFPSVRVLRHWCSPRSLQYMHEQGHRLSLYGVGWRAHELMANQVLFRREDSVLLRQVPLTRLIGVPFVRATRVMSHAVL